MSDARFVPCGGWSSPISAELATTRTVDLSRGLGQIQLDGEDTYWIEGRVNPTRNVIVSFGARGEVSDAVPPPFHARTRAHEYGGGEFTVAAGSVFFANDLDQRLYRRDRYRRPVPITPPGPWRYADLTVDRNRNRLICVREDHEAAGREPISALVAVDKQGHTRPLVLVSGSDFYSSPRVSRDGTKLAWLSWNHPNMPWDATELWLGQLSKEGAVLDARRIAGGDSESIFQPEWSPAGFLYFVSDRTGWWNLYRIVGDQQQSVCPRSADFGVPQWNFGATTYGFESEKRIVCSFQENGTWHLASVDAEGGALTVIPTPYTEIAHLRVRRQHAIFRAASPQVPYEIVRFDLTRRVPLSLRHGGESLEARYFSMPEAVQFATTGEQQAHGFFYPPANPEYAVPEGEKPPLIV
ncbi:MAG TPA: hypothetical protein VEB21_02425, partial [Terriglobales bacterium]|nr:hypothetical protein [Terriglobales bacterium]